MTDDIILPEDDRAATYRTDICGWVSRNGKFYGEGERAEEIARLAGATHWRCDDCGTIIENRYTRCSTCSDKRAMARYLSLPEADWDGEAPLYSYTTSEFYNDLDEAEDRLDDGQTLDDLRLVICVPEYARPLDLDLFEDQLPEDVDAPDELQDAIDTFNESIKGLQLSWEPGKTRIRASCGQSGGNHEQ